MMLRYFFIFVKLCLFSSFVNARIISKSDGSQLLNRTKLSELAIRVCNDLMAIADEELKRACPENFMKEDLESSQKREVNISLSNGSLELKTTPLDNFQIVILVPEKDDDVVDTYVNEYIYPNMDSCEISIKTPHVDYVIYSTMVNEVGRTLPWQVAGTVPASTSVPPQVRVHFLSSTAENSTTGVVTWYIDDDTEESFEFGNYCPKIGMTSFNVTPATGPKVVLKKLPLNDQCFIRLTGQFGTIRTEYHTPSSPSDGKMDKALDEPVRPEKPANISLLAKKTGDDDKWTIHVSWAAPREEPEIYNVTVLTDGSTSVIVPGNATSAVILDVSGKAMYQYTVSVSAYNGRRYYHNLAEGVFPQYVNSEWIWGEAAGGAWGAVGLLALLLWWLRVRRKTHHLLKPKGHETKPLDVTFDDSETECCEDKWEIKAERLVLHEVIGEGAFGVVRRGSLAPGGKDVAVKMLKDFPTLDEMRSFRFEMELMKSVGAHPHVVSLVGCCSRKRGLIVAEYCARGDLLSCLRSSWDVMASKHSSKYSTNNNIETETCEYRNDLFKCKLRPSQSRLVVNKMYDLQHCDSEFTSSDLLSFCRQIAMGMEFLAANRLVHRDLAARNVLVTADRTLKIADFGLSRDVYEQNQYKQKGNGKMPVKWMALESLTRRIYTSQSDVWSFGIVMWEVITVGGSPYPEIPAVKVPKLLRGGYRMPRPLNCSKQLYDLMRSCWHAHPRERPTFAELHQRLDELLNCACADEYLCLELVENAPPTPKAQRYFNMLFRGKLWSRDYERPLKLHQGNYNHYSSPPVTMAKAPV